MTAKSYTEASATGDQKEGVNSSDNMNDANGMVTLNVNTNKTENASTRGSVNTVAQRGSSVNAYTARQATSEIPKIYKLITIQMQLNLLLKDDLDMTQDLLLMYATLV